MQFNFGNYNVPQGMRRPVFNNLGFLSPVSLDYLQNDPQAVYSGFMQGLKGQGASPMFQGYAEKWLPRAYGDYKYQQAINPTAPMEFMDYLNRQGNTLQDEYLRSLPTRPPIRRTRMLWSR